MDPQRPTSKPIPRAVAGPRAAEREEWNAMKVYLPDSPTEWFDLTARTTFHNEFADVQYYAIRAWLHWYEEGQPYSLYILHYCLEAADHGCAAKDTWGPLKLNRIELRLRHLRFNDVTGKTWPLYSTDGSFLMIHETGATISAHSQKLCGRLSHHISHHEAKDLLKSEFAPFMHKLQLQAGEGYLGRTIPPVRPTSGEASSATPPLRFRNEEMPDTSLVQVHTRQLEMIAKSLVFLASATEGLSDNYNWHQRYVKLQGTIKAIQLAHRARLAMAPRGQNQ